MRHQIKKLRHRRNEVVPPTSEVGGAALIASGLLEADAQGINHGLRTGHAVFNGAHGGIEERV